jgi:imidazolonepropionase-like amidohydrolase
LGEAQTWQNRELAIRAELEPAADVLRSIYRVNAKLCGLEGEIGVLAPGASADLLVTQVDPLSKLGEFAEPESALDVVIGRGHVAVDRLA